MMMNIIYIVYTKKIGVKYYFLGDYDYYQVTYFDFGLRTPWMFECGNV